jgi:proton-dependent oligopeptide transporter, POT family
MLSAVKNYFSEFRILKTATREFWLVNGIQFLDSLAYFAMVNVITLYLTTNCGFSDVDSGAWVGYWSLYVTAFVLAVGSICDVIGLRKSFFFGITLMFIARLGLGVSPLLLDGARLQGVVKGFIILWALATAFMSPIVITGVRKFTTKENRSTGFNMYYLIMNVGAIFAGFAVTDGMRKWLGEIKGNLAIMDFGFAMSLLCFVLVIMMNDKLIPDPSERVLKQKADRPLKIFTEVWKQSAFQKLVLFLVLTIGVRLVFTHQFLVMPKYYTRVMFTDFNLGFANSINPIIIVTGLILLIPVINRFSTFKLVVIGMTISAASLVFMVLPIEWLMRVPGVRNLNQAYLFVIYGQILVFAIGELIFSPRFTEYISVVAPKDRVASYMSLSALPMFIAKPLNGFLSGILISKYSYDGIRAKIDSGNISYKQSPGHMWMIYFGLALLSPIAVIAMRRVLTSAHVKEGQAATDSAATEPA